MLIWTIDKFVRPAHAISVYEHFYFLPGFGGTIIYVIGVAELLLLLGFVIGFAPRVTYGLVFLFFAAWPMLGACFTLYYLRDLDTLWSVSGKKG
jgi:putative oxidoreductase